MTNSDCFKYFNQGYVLVHCVWSDFQMTAGIANSIRKKFGRPPKNLRKSMGITGYAVYQRLQPQKRSVIHMNVSSVVPKNDHYSVPLTTEQNYTYIRDQLEE